MPKSFSYEDAFGAASPQNFSYEDAVGGGEDFSSLAEPIELTPETQIIAALRCPNW
jgi:hypothetical protein